LEIAELRPLSLGELLDRAFTIYRGNFLTFAGIMAIPAALGIPITFFVLRFDTTMFANPAAPVAPSPQAVLGFLALYFVFLFIATIVYSVVAGAMTFAVSEAYLGRKSTISAAYRSVRGKIWRLFGLALNIMLRLAGIAILVTFVVGGVGVLLISATALATRAVAAGMPPAVIGFVFGVMALALYVLILATMVYLALRYAVAIPALALENLGVLASIRRSVRLTKGRRGHVFVAMLLAFIISLVGTMVFYMPFYIPTMVMMIRDHSVPTWLSLLSAVSAALGSCATSPVFMIVLVLCYYDTRVRKEAFDLQFMMASLDRPSAVPSTVPSA
jgi:Membrane domain of glycerophosphoryl diester phosphodiesterase